MADPTILTMPDPFKSVAVSSPPASIMASATKLVIDASSTLSPGARGAIVPIITTEGGNLAVVDKVNAHVRVVGWVGKKWGQPLSAGGAGIIEW